MNEFNPRKILLRGFQIIVLFYTECSGFIAERYDVVVLMYRHGNVLK